VSTLDDPRAAELALQILAAHTWRDDKAQHIPGLADAIATIAQGSTSYAPDTDPQTVGRILIGVAATVAHIPDASLAVAMNLVAAAGAQLIEQRGGRRP
jgi:hypothetical protein